MEASKKTNLLENKKIAIIGGGPGGLTLARLLQLKGADVKVYERDINQQARVQGAIVDLHFESGLKAIEAAGLVTEFKESYMHGADRYRILDKDGNIRYDEMNKESPVTFGDEDFRPEIDRGILRNVLVASLYPGTVVWDSQFVDMSQEAGVWTIQFKNGTTATADIVIGSDGARSKIRPFVTAVKPLYAGITIIQGEINKSEKECLEVYKLVNNGNVMAFGEGKVITLQPRGDGGLTLYVSAEYPENWGETSGVDFENNKEVCAYLEKFHSGWDPLFFKIFNAVDTFVLRPLHSVPVDQNWEAHANITLIGDAAHIMLPSGEGVNAAMLDALELSKYLTSNDFPDLQNAMAAYENDMRTRAALLSQDAVEGTERMYSKGALDTFVNDFMEMNRHQ